MKILAYGALGINTRLMTREVHEVWGVGRGGLGRGKRDVGCGS